jgi:ribonuclease D
MDIFIAKDFADFEVAYEKLKNSKIIGCDTETSSLSVNQGRLLSVQFSDGEFAVLVPFSAEIGIGNLAKLLSDEKITKVFHNAKFDLKFLRKYSFGVRNVFCTMIAEKIITKGANQSISLAETLYRYFGVNLDKSQRLIFTDQNWDGYWTKELIEYTVLDVFYLPKLMIEQRKFLEKLGLMEEFRLEMKKQIDGTSYLELFDSNTNCP